MVRKIEKTIMGKMSGIKEGRITPKESGIGFLFNKLKTLDEPSYEKLLGEYKKILVNK